MRKAIILSLLLLLPSAVFGIECARISVGYAPLPELGPSLYQGRQGGLYPDGMNFRPAVHDAAGFAFARSIQPLDGAGNPSANGSIVLISVGMSNTTQEFSTFVPLANADPDKNPKLVIVDGAQGGWSADRIIDPNASFWTTINSRLATAGVTPNQVQVAWIKEADASPNLSFPADALKLRDELKTVAQILKSRYPNLKLVYLSSRIYGGYASTTLNPEPYAYQSGFAVKWLIEQQINGDPELNYDGLRGAIRSAWLAWGPYLWADGMRARSDGLTWTCADFQSDGTHPATGARQKVANLLLNFFKTDSTTQQWFLTNPPSGITSGTVNYLVPPWSVQTFQARNGSNDLQVGYGLAISTAGATPAGVSIFSLKSSFGGLITEASVEAASPTQEALVFVDQRSTRATGVAIAAAIDPRIARPTQEGTLTFTLFGADGTRMREVQRRLIESNQIALFTDEIFGLRIRDFVGTMRIESTLPIYVTALRATTNHRGETILASLPVGLNENEAAGQAVVPHVVVGGGLSTQFVLLNAGGQTIQGQVSFFNQDGSPLNFAGSTSVNYNIPPNGVQVIEPSGSLTTMVVPRVGFAIIRSNPENRLPAASALFSTSEVSIAGATDPPIVSEVGVNAAAPTPLALAYVNTKAPINTGLALANPSDSPTRYFLTLFSLDGREGATIERSLGAGQQTALFLDQFFGEAGRNFEGTVRIRSDAPLALTTLRVAPNLRELPMLTVVPLANLNQPAANSLLVFPQAVIGGGFTTQWILLSSAGNETQSGTFYFYRQDGSLMNFP